MSQGLAHWILIRQDTKKAHHLDEQFVWMDEYSYCNVITAQAIYTLTGAMIIEQGIKKAGRPISLSGEHVWATRQLLATLHDIWQTPNLTCQLHHPDGRQFVVLLTDITNIRHVQNYKDGDKSMDDKVQFDLKFVVLE